MMRTHDRLDGIGELNAFQNLGANGRVDFHLFEFFGGERAGLGNDVFGHGQLANVVQQRGGAHGFHILIRQAEFTSKQSGHQLHAVQLVMGRIILGFNR